jgi:hypothetical protein
MWEYLPENDTKELLPQQETSTNRTCSNRNEGEYRGVAIRTALSLVTYLLIPRVDSRGPALGLATVNSKVAR